MNDLKEINATLENQRYGRNKATLINKSYINSGEYRRKFNEVSVIPEVARSVYNCAKEALYHRSGTVFEDMYWFDSRTGEVIAKKIDSETEHRVDYSQKIEKTLKSCDTSKLIAVHTHPGSMPPSVADFNSACAHGYGVCYVATHDGKLLGYTSHELIDEGLLDAYAVKFMSKGYSEFDAQIAAIEETKKNKKIDFWEVK